MVLSHSEHEATAVARSFARSMRDMFIALRSEGFTEKQALAILGEVLSGVIGTALKEE